jgi:hypothetical protein
MPRLTANPFALLNGCFKPSEPAGEAAAAAQTPPRSPFGLLRRAPAAPSAVGAASGRRLSKLLPRALQSAEQIEAEMQATIARIEAFYERDNGSSLELTGSFEYKKALLLRLIQKNSPHVGQFFRHMKIVGATAREISIRHQVLTHLMTDLNAEKEYAITKILYNSIKTAGEMPFLMTIGKKFAERDDHYENPIFTNYLDALRQRRFYSNMLPLPIYNHMGLIKIWALHSASPVNGPNGDELESYLRIDKYLDCVKFFEFDSTEITPLMRTLHEKAMAVNNANSEISSHIHFAAAHLIGNKFSAAQEETLMVAYESLLSQQEPRTFLMCSRIMGQAVQSSTGAKNLYAALNLFNNQALGVLMLGAVNGDMQLIYDFSAVLNKVKPDDAMHFSVNAFAEFSGCHHIKNDNKQRLLKIVLAAVLKHKTPAIECIELLKNLGAIAERINTRLPERGIESDNRSSSFYCYPFLPHCQNVTQLKAAANPEPAAIELLAETIHKGSHLEHLMRQLGTKSKESLRYSMVLDPIIFTKTELIKYSKKLIPKFVEECSIKKLEEKMYWLSNLLYYPANGWDSLCSPKVTLFFHQEVSDNCPQIYAIEQKARTEKNRHLRRYASLAAFLMLDTAPAVRESAAVKNMLAALAEFHGEDTRLPVMVCFYQSIREPEMAKQFEVFATGFKKHTQVFAAPIFVLSNYGQHTETLNTLTAMVNTKRFKDTKKALLVLEFICDMVACKTIDAKDKCHMVQRLVEEAKLVKTGMTMDMVGVSGLAKLAAVDKSDSSAATAALNHIAQGGDIHQAKALLFKVLYGVGDNEAAAFASAYENYLKTARAPTALPAYAMSIYMSNVNSEDREKVMAEIGLIARGLVANDGGITFNNIRYGTENNDHNTLMQTKAPAAWKTWQEEVSFESDIEYTNADVGVIVNCDKYLKEKIVSDRHVEAGTFPLLEQVLNETLSVMDALKKLETHAASKTPTIEKTLLQALQPELSNQARAAHLQSFIDMGADTQFPQLSQDVKDLQKRLTAGRLDIKKLKTLRASISSQPEDLFLIGTEVGGSCQSIHGSPGLNKALPGFVLCGKYLSAQVSKADGSLMYRRMLRLVWSEKLNAPVIHIEREYTNPGVPQKIKDACLELVFDKAEKMGVHVASNDKALITSHGSKEKLTLNAYKTPRAFEYVDAERGIQTAGTYSINSAVVLVSRH